MYIKSLWQMAVRFIRWQSLKLVHLKLTYISQLTRCFFKKAKSSWNSNSKLYIVCRYLCEGWNWFEVYSPCIGELIVSQIDSINLRVWWDVRRNKKKKSVSGLIIKYRRLCFSRDKGQLCYLLKYLEHETSYSIFNSLS